MSSNHDLWFVEGAFNAMRERFAALGLNKPLSAQNLEAGKVEFARKTQYMFSLLDSINLCVFVWGPSWQLYGPEHIVKLIKAVTGWDVTIAELLEVGERRLNMMRAFNAREKISREQDKLPEKFFKKALKGGPTNGWKLDKKQFESALNEYYRQCGWDEKTGTPTRETLERLRLTWLADDLEL